jgi:NADPH:quinone reductase
MSATMRAAYVAEACGPEGVTVRELPAPEPGPGQVRIRVAYAALNPLDAHARAFRIKWNHPGFPFVPGYEYAGRVDAVGAGVDAALVGRRVAARGEWGGNGELALATAARVVTLPEPLSWQVGAAFSTSAVSAWHLVHSAGRLRAGMHLVVHSAAGSVGALVTQIAKEAGAVVYGLAGGPDKVAYAKQFGADHLIDYRGEDWVARFKALSGGRGADVIVDGNAGPDAAKNYDAIAPLGNVIYIGAMAGQAPDVNVSLLVGKSFSVTGFVQFFHQARTHGAEEAEIAEKLATGRWRIPIERVFALDEIAQAHRLFEARALRGRSLIRLAGEI